MTYISSAGIVNFWVPGGVGGGDERPVDLPNGVAAGGLHLQVGGADVVESSEPQLGVLELRLRGAEQITITAIVPARDAVTWWTPGSAAPHASLPPSWAPAADLSAFAGIPLGVLTRGHNETALAYAVDGGLRPVNVRAGLVEESASFAVMIRIPAAGDSTVRLRLDVSGQEFARAATGVGRWLQEPYPVRFVAGAEDPVLCTWYFAHLDVTDEIVLAQADLAAAYGFGTVIVDDGWQTSRTERGYASCGDWDVAAEKFPHPRAFVDRLREHGLRTVWWVGTPFIGHRSKAIERGLATLADDADLEASVLDPRDPTTRAHLVNRVRQLLMQSGAEGLKLDFLERFAATADDDKHAVMVAAERLLEEIVTAAREIVPDVLIEFREPYVHPAVARHSTMIRVEDCPMSAVQNRLGIIDTRLSVPGIPVHSDPIMWGDEESDTRVAQHLINALFGVPQVSVDLAGLSKGHASTLSFWLSFWRENRDILLHGELAAESPEQQYPVIHARSGSRHVLVRYAAASLTLPGTWDEVRIVNADWSPPVLLCASRVQGSLTIRDAHGTVVEESEFSWSAGAHTLNVPTGGVALLERR